MEKKDQLLTDFLPLEKMGDGDRIRRGEGKNWWGEENVREGERFKKEKNKREKKNLFNGSQAMGEFEEDHIYLEWEKNHEDHQILNRTWFLSTLSSSSSGS